MSNSKKKSDKNNLKNSSKEIEYNEKEELDNLSEELNKLNDINNISNIVKTNKNIEEKIKLTPEQNLNLLYDELYKVLLKSDCKCISGELISYKQSDANAYISIKIFGFQISCIFWQISKSSNYSFYKNFKDGDKIKFEGNFSILKKNFSIYFNIKSMEKVGIGDYLALHNELRKMISDMELDKNKKILKKFPYNIGIVTSIEGAAIQDILQTLKLDNFIGKVTIVNAVVQGKSCPQSVISGLSYFENNNNDVDLVLITRGGGSFEDLVGFSDWELVNKISKTNLITLSAVGHQIDNQLSDEVADYKFATPSIAAKFIVEKQKEFIDRYINFKNILDFYKDKYIKSLIKFQKINENYDSILENFSISEIKDKLYKYSTMVKDKLQNYNSAKKSYYNYAVDLKPTLYIKSKEINSIQDIISAKSKKIDIVLPDGKIKISFKIEEIFENQ